MDIGRFLAVLLLLGTATHSGPAVKNALELPGFLFIGSAEEDSVLTMKCDGKPPYSQITCQFLQVGVSKKSDDEIKKSIAKARETVAGWSELEVRKQTKNVCDQLANLASHPVPTTFTPGKRAAAEKGLAQLRQACDCKTRACVEQWVVRAEETDGRDCKVSVQRFATTFSRTGLNKWVSSHGPEGICNLVTVQVIEREENSPTLWTYTQTTPSGDTTGPLCSGFRLNIPEKFSWHYPTGTLLECANIDFEMLSF